MVMHLMLSSNDLKTLITELEVIFSKQLIYCFSDNEMKADVDKCNLRLSSKGEWRTEVNGQKIKTSSVKIILAHVLITN